MNTNALKRFAREARIKLIDQVGRKLEFVLSNADPVFIDTNASQIQSLKNKIQAQGKEQVIDTVAYTWFNRLMALRFMDANGYTTPKVVTPVVGKSPEILQNALSGQIDENLKINRQRLNDLLDGKVVISDAQTEAYKMLLIATCNQWHTAMPFMFERISDYTELLLPDDLLSGNSIVSDLREGMSDEDCGHEEILGWLYQFYISDENARLIKSKNVYKKEELAPASQLFTPKWIVKYMVDNTLGQLWSEINPATTILGSLEFYIKPAYKEQLQPRPKKRIEEIKFFEPCVGSAHILSYAFDVFYLMYEEQGYNATEIAELIIKNNLFGVDIDERAAQIASFVLMMKGRRKSRSFLRKNITPNITFYEDFEGDGKFSNCKALGSLVNIEPNEIDKIKVEEGSVFADRQIKLKKLYTLLGQRYDCVVTNPPYISSSRMEGTLKQFVEANYPDTKSDLFATFIIRCLELCNEDGLTGYMTPFVWMFISSYEKLRVNIIDNHFINNLIQLEYSGFDGATVPICTFTLRNTSIENGYGSYVRLSDFKGSENQAPKTLEAIQNNNCGWFYTANQKDFNYIKENPIGYWASKNVFFVFNNYPPLASKYKVESGFQTGNDSLFLRYWYEISFNKIGFEYNDYSQVDFTKHCFFPMNKEEGFKKWAGRYRVVVHFEKDGKNFKNVEGLNYRLRETKFYFKPGISWGDVTSAKSSYRYQEPGLIFARRAPMFFTTEKYICSILNSKIVNHLQGFINPTLSFNLSDMDRVPILNSEDVPASLNNMVEECIKISKIDSDKTEMSWNFISNEIIELKASHLVSAIQIIRKKWENYFYQILKLEEDINRALIHIYCLDDVLTEKVPLEEITILQEESKIINGELFIDPVPVLLQLVSYSVGCKFGRYSLNKPGPILANQGETILDFLKQVANPSFIPDEDNIIPVLEGEWFTDDIVGRFKVFLKAAFGEQHFEENLKYIEDTIGKDIRKYFVKDFYNEHIKRYKKRPIYWMFSSPKGHFKALIYMHRYTPDLCSKMLTDYLQSYIHKMEAAQQNKIAESLREDLPARDKTAATKEADRYSVMIKDCKEYAQTLYAVATKKIAIDLDDGVKVNYQKFKEVVVPIKGLEKDEE
jgi:hypothetical protein